MAAGGQQHHRWFLHPPAKRGGRGGQRGGIEGIWLTMLVSELSEEMMVTDFGTNITTMLPQQFKQYHCAGIPVK